MSDATGPVLSADGTPLKVSLNRALRREKTRAFLLVLPLLAFILITFIAPIADMLFRSVENSIVQETIPRTVQALRGWDAAVDRRHPGWFQGAGDAGGFGGGARAGRKPRPGW